MVAANPGTGVKLFKVADTLLAFHLLLARIDLFAKLLLLGRFGGLVVFNFAFQVEDFVFYRCSILPFVLGFGQSHLAVEKLERQIFVLSVQFVDLLFK